MTTEAQADAAGEWQGGWFLPARRLESPNHGPRPPRACVDLIVVHAISLPPGRYGGREVEDFFLNRLDTTAHPALAALRGVQVSAHFFLRRDGELVQFVDCDRRAWHAGASSWRGRRNCNDDSVGIELEGLDGRPFEAAQYAALAALCSAIGARYPIAFIAGHEHIAPGRKHDPGAAFDWRRLQRGLGWAPAMFPPGVIDG